MYLVMESFCHQFLRGHIFIEHPGDGRAKESLLLSGLTEDAEHSSLLVTILCLLFSLSFFLWTSHCFCLNCSPSLCLSQIPCFPSAVI